MKPRRPFFHLITKPSGLPRQPTNFSFSFLKKWGECPAKYFLENGAYEHLGYNQYPNLVNPAQIEGILIHGLIEHFIRTQKSDQIATHSEVIQRAQPRAYLRAQLQATKETLIQNPRIEYNQVLAQVSLDKVINVAKSWFMAMEVEVSSVPQNSGPKTSSSAGSEVRITVEDPPLMGILDLVIRDEIIDFKTGAKAESHSAQMKFYALLWFLKFGNPPSALKLLYSQDGSHESIQVPTEPELEKAAAEIRSTIVAVRSSFASKVFGSNFEIERCRYCGVRQHCDDYWSRLQTAESANKIDFLDLRLKFERPIELLSDRPLRISFRELSLVIDQRYFPPVDNKITEVRILNVQRNTEPTPYLRLIRTSEVFWKFEI